MKLGLGLPQRKGVDLRTDIKEAARTAEAAGFSSLWTYERLLFPLKPHAGHRCLTGHPASALAGQHTRRPPVGSHP